MDGIGGVAWGGAESVVRAADRRLLCKCVEGCRSFVRGSRAARCGCVEGDGTVVRMCVRAMQASHKRIDGESGQTLPPSKTDGRSDRI
uniref:Uncharacterized protein n=1 Tax=Arundo donax TaxID=35708 RepID=A0A0A8ZHB1_ARUDO